LLPTHVSVKLMIGVVFVSEVVVW